MTTTVWVFGDQLNRAIGALAEADPSSTRVLMVESTGKMEAKAWHVQRAHFLIASMRRFAAELTADGFAVDYRRAASFADGLAAHRAEWAPERVVATEPNSWSARQLLVRLDVHCVVTNQFLCHADQFAAWATGRKTVRMEDFYRTRRRATGYLMDGDEPLGGRWNFDADNREPPPKPGTMTWPRPPASAVDELDHAVLADLPDSLPGSPPDGTWATTRSDALARLDHFVTHVLPLFGPHEDAMLVDQWHLAHSMLSPYLNNGLLLPGEVCDAVDAAYRRGGVPLASAEGFIRQVIGWREFVWGLYWAGMPDYATENALGAHRPIPPAFRPGGTTSMRCVSTCMDDLDRRAWLHHIQRLMILGNLALIAGIDPQAMVEWMWAGFVDSSEWVMVPNLVGMSLYADGGRMATKPYASGGAYIDRMSDYCKECVYDRKLRVGPTACPFTTLYWDFLLRHEDRFLANPRMGTQVRAARKLSDVEAVQQRAVEVLDLLDAGQL